MTSKLRKIIFASTIGAAAIALSPVFGAAPAPTKPVSKPAAKPVYIPVIRPTTAPVGMVSTARMTRFNPETQGFRFINTFLNVTGVFDITTGGLCGGMVYAVLDYFNAGRSVPRQNFTPVDGTALQSYLWNRNMHALGDHMDKWVELHGNPFGARNSEFFKWGLQGTGGGRLQELRTHIDAGRPVPLGLKSLSANPGEDHVVLAYGYDMGRYRGDLGANQEDLKIYIYEPNYGNRKVTMVPKPGRSEWCYLEANHDGEIPCWRTYFVQQNYRRQTAPAVADNPVEYRFRFKTGGDDLRGGNDNVGVKIHLTDGRTISAPNLNRGKRWMNGSENIVAVSLPDTVRAGQVRSTTITTAFRGGFDGDNWNLEGVVGQLYIGNSYIEGCAKGGAPLVRFTGSTHDYELPGRCS